MIRQEHKIKNCYSYTEEEVCKIYLNSERTNESIKILHQLTGLDTHEIREILSRHKVLNM